MISCSQFLFSVSAELILLIEYYDVIIVNLCKRCITQIEE